MAVRSQALVTEEEKRPRRPTPAMLSRGGVIGAMIGILRIIAVLLMVASTFGNYVQFVGGWGLYWPINWPIIGVALLYQVVCSLLQWGFKAANYWIPYAIALIASAIPSYLTYNAWAGPYLAAQLGSALAFFVLALSTLGADALPEWVLVE
jgi:hypothetical protein